MSNTYRDKLIDLLVEPLIEEIQSDLKHVVLYGYQGTPLEEMSIDELETLAEELEITW